MLVTHANPIANPPSEIPDSQLCCFCLAGASKFISADALNIFSICTPQNLLFLSDQEGGRWTEILTNQAVQGQSLCENEDEDHSDEKFWLLGVGPASKPGSANEAKALKTADISLTHLSKAHCDPITYQDLGGDML